MKKHVLEVDSVQKSYDNKLVLSDVYLKCETGEIIGLLGRNGSGKSTLLKIIFGIEKAEFKFVRIDHSVKVKTSDLFRDISYLSQENFIPRHFTVAKAIQLSIEKNAIENFYKDDFIQNIKDNKISQLSGGEMRYLEIKIVLSNASKFILLDEPYNGLSPVMIEKVNALLLQNAAKKGIIITDHNYENVISIATKLIVIKDQKVHHIKDKYDLIDKGYLSENAFKSS